MLDRGACVLKDSRGAIHGSDGFCRNAGSAQFNHANSQLWDRRIVEISYDVVRCHRIGKIRTRYDREHQSQIPDAARHWTDNSHGGKWSDRRWKVASCGNPARRRLESADTTKMRRHSHRTTTVAAYA